MKILQNSLKAVPLRIALGIPSFSLEIFVRLTARIKEIVGVAFKY